MTVCRFYRWPQNHLFRHSTRSYTMPMPMPMPTLTQCRSVCMHRNYATCLPRGICRVDPPPTPTHPRLAWWCGVYGWPIGRNLLRDQVALTSIALVRCHDLMRKSGVEIPTSCQVPRVSQCATTATTTTLSSIGVGTPPPQLADDGVRSDTHLSTPLRRDCTDGDRCGRACGCGRCPSR